MYGMVNKGIEDLITTKWGVDTWKAIKEDAGFNEDSFLTIKSYPDELTYQLVGSASKILNLPSDQILEAFGEYWILFTAEKGYSELLNLTGHSFPEFLRNLDMLHSHVANIMPKLAPPSFYVQNEKERSLELVYESQRQGLITFLIGLIKGLGKRFELDCAVKEIPNASDNASVRVFLIEW